MILDIFNPSVTENVTARINQLSNETPAKWGKMNVGQMLAHCNVTYEMVYDTKHKAPGFPVNLILRLFVKKYVTGEAPYKKSSGTAPSFIISDQRDFEVEKARLISYIERVASEGRTAFEGKKSLSFGKLTSQEWNNMFYKHLDHHLTQFGV